MITKQTLYKKTSTGATQGWTIVQENDQYYTISGQIDGKMVKSKPTICQPKNVGKSSQTSGVQQAISETNSKIKLKLDEGYVYSIEDIDASSEKFAPMLAKEYNKFKHKIKYPCAAQPKFDGVRSNTSLQNKQLSREGRPQISAPHLFEAVKNVLTDEYVLDGEIYNHNLKDDFDQIISLARKTKPTENDLLESSKVLQYHIYDIYVKNKPEMLFFDRLEVLRELFVKQINSSSLVLCETIICNNEKELDDAYDKFLESGYEGMMVRNNTPYQQKRTENLLKRKEFQDAEFEVLDIIEGQGNRSGMAGTVLLKLNDKGHTFNSSATGGESFYKDLLTNKDKYIGKMATVKFQNYTPGGVPRFPTIKVIDRNYE